MSAKPSIDSIFCSAIEVESLDERRALVEQACGEDVDLKQQVERLLHAHFHGRSILDAPVQPVATVDEAAREQSGTVIGPYKLLEQIGEGGMGSVWMAQQTEPVKRLVAVKLIKAGMDSKQVIARFEAERQALALMDHPNIARVLDAGATSAGRPYFVMDLVKGVPITGYCDEHHLTPRQRLELFIPVCQAVQHAHQKGIIHRDLKPSNVLVALYDGKPVPKVIDFGVAKAAGQSLTDKTLVTGLGAIVGTLEYMSPEQAEINQLDIDTRSDIYSLGVLLYELLAGSPPFTRKELEKAGMLEVLRVIREQEPSKPSTKLSTAEALPTLAANRGTEPAKLTKLVRGELDWIVMKSLEKDRNRRYPTANGFAMDVQRYLADEAVLACPPSVGYRLQKFARRNKAGLATTGLIVLFVVLVGAGVGWMSRDRAARRHAVEEAVGRALEDADELQRRDKWQEAVAAAERAEAALASGEAGAELQAQVRERLTDLRLIQRLEELRVERGDHIHSENQDRAYTRVFAEAGLDAEGLTPPEIAARIQRRPATAVRVAAALDDWAQVRRDWLRLEKHDPATWKRLLEAARLADPDPWRGRLRQLMGQEDLKALRQLADESDITTLPVQSLQLMANALIFGGDHQGCVAWLRKAQRQHPGDVIINSDLALHLAGLPAPPWQDVLRFFQAALAARPESPRLHLLAAWALVEVGRFDDAIDLCHRVIELKPEESRAYFDLAGALARKDCLNEAIAALHKALELKPDFTEAYSRLGDVLRKNGQLDEAVAAYRKTVELQPDSAAAHKTLGDAFEQRGKHDQAILAYHKAIERKDCAEYQGALGLALGNMGSHDEAITAFLRAIELKPDDAWAYFNLGVALGITARLDEAIAAYRKAIELKPDYAEAHNNLGSALHNKGRLDEAIAACRKAIELKPDYARAHYNLGVTLAGKRQYNEAIAAYRKAIELKPDCARSHGNLGGALQAAGNFEEAIRVYKQALDLQPANAAWNNNLAWLLATCPASKLRNPAEAVRMARRAVNLAPKEASFWNTLGVAQYYTADWKAALAALDKSMQLQRGGDSLDWFFLAMAQWKLDQKEQGRKSYDRAVEWMDKNQPQNEELRRFRTEAAKVLGIEQPPTEKAK